MVEGGEGVFDVVGGEGVWWMLLLFVEIVRMVLCLKWWDLLSENLIEGEEKGKKLWKCEVLLMTVINGYLSDIRVAMLCESCFVERRCEWCEKNEEKKTKI